MIQLASLSGSTPETPAIAGVSAPSDGEFSKFLKGVEGKTGSPRGEGLPGGGKDLPVQLPLDIAAVKAAASAKGKSAAIEGRSVVGKEEPAEPIKETGAEAAESPDGIAAKSIGTVIAMIAAPAGGKPATGEGEAEGDPQQTGKAGKPGVTLAEAKWRAEHKIDLAAHAKPASQPAAPAEAGEQAEMAQAQPFGQKALRREEPQIRTAKADVAIEAASKPKLSEGAELAALRASSGSSPSQANGQSIAVAQIADVSGADTSGKAGAHSINQPQAVRPHDFAALVDRLVEARDSGRAASGNLSVMHSDFGTVTMRFSHDGGNLQVSLANADPEFARSVSAALPADSSGKGDGALHNGQDDGDPQQFMASAGTGDQRGGTHGSAGDGTLSGDLAFGDPQAEPSDEQLRSEGQHFRSSNSGGIFA